MIGAAMVLAAGRGERMRPLSKVVPKPALPLADGPIIASALRLARTVTDRVVVNTWYLADAMERCLRSIDDISIRVSREPERMGTAGGLALARDRGLLGDHGPVLVINGDSVLHLEVRPLVDRLNETGAHVVLGLLPHLDPLLWSRVLLAPDGRIDRIVPAGAPATGEVPFLYPGMMLISRAALDRLPTRPGNTPEELWRPALAAGRCVGVPTSGYWREVGTPLAYLEAALAGLATSSVIHPDARVDPTAAVGLALIGRDVRIEADAVVGDAVIAEGATVNRGARVFQSVLMGRVEARPGENIVERFIAPD